MICIVLLAYKEAKNLAWMLPEIIKNIKKTGEEFHIIVVDSKKTLDNTPDVCRQYGARYINQEFPGFGGAYKTAIKYASGDMFLILDSDGQHNPKYIPRLVKTYMSGKYDVVIGSRYVKGGKNNEKFLSRIMSKILNYAFRICLGIRVHDISTNFRIYDLAQLKKIDLESRNLDVLQEILMKMKLENPRLRVGEVPIELDHRAYGESKRRLLLFIMDYMKSLVKLTCLRIRWSIKKG